MYLMDGLYGLVESGLREGKKADMSVEGHAGEGN